MKKFVCMLAFLFAGYANAALITFGPASASGSGPLITFDNLVTPTSITGDATVTLNINGDLNSASEYVDITFDGFSLGRILDNNTSNDLFNFAGDAGNQSSSTITATAIISGSTFASLIADGFLNLAFQSSLPVNCCGSINHLSGSISFDSSNSVSEPASFLLLGLGLAGLGFGRRKTKA